MLSVSSNNKLTRFYEFENEEFDHSVLQDLLDKNYFHPSNVNPYITLTAGSDTRAILAILLHYGMNPEAIVFGDERNLETFYVEKLCSKYNIHLNFINSKIDPAD